MKIIIEKEILIKNLEIVSRALSTRNIIPILNGIKFDVNKKGVVLTATDSNISIEVSIPKKDVKDIREEGSAVIIGGIKLLEILNKQNNGDLIIESYGDNNIIFKINNLEYKANCLYIENYPEINFEENKEKIVFDSLVFKSVIEKTSFACSLQKGKNYLTGVNIKINGNLFECVATDSYRVSIIKLELDKTYSNNYNIIIPARDINELSKLLNSEEKIEIHIQQNKVLFILNNIKFQSSLINGTYPDLDKSLFKNFEYVYSINNKELLRIVNTAYSIVQVKGKQLINIKINNNSLELRAFNSDLGVIEDKIEIENFNNNNFELTFNAKYMIEALKIFNKEKVLLLLNKSTAPFLLKEEDNDGVLEIILPNKTQ